MKLKTGYLVKVSKEGAAQCIGPQVGRCPSGVGKIVRFYFGAPAVLWDGYKNPIYYAPEFLVRIRPTTPPKGETE